jgi:hypothetical protein
MCLNLSFFINQGKCIDYIFEDVDQMQAEHAKWSRDFAKNKALFEVEKLKTKGARIFN